MLSTSVPLQFLWTTKLGPFWPYETITGWKTRCTKKVQEKQARVTVPPNCYRKQANFQVQHGTSLLCSRLNLPSSPSATYFLQDATNYAHYANIPMWATKTPYEEPTVRFLELSLKERINLTLWCVTWVFSVSFILWEAANRCFLLAWAL